MYAIQTIVVPEADSVTIDFSIIPETCNNNNGSVIAFAVEGLPAIPIYGLMELLFHQLVTRMQVTIL
ncbi:MAG: hypothetical protein IPP71_19480 [Bacteroidetes bacterium]|nr:hypothetical protein [Bacteroidota bacterium]